MQEQNTTVRKKGQHLTSFERGRIATLHSQGYSNRAIARALNVCHQTINNELCRGEIDQVKKVNGQRQYYAVYSPETAQAKYEANRAHCHRPLKLVGVADFIGLKSIFETDFKRHSEPRLPSTAQINH